MVDNLVDILVLSTLAGLATGFGGLVVVVVAPGKRLFGFLMGLAAGIMITFSFLELMSEALKISGLFLAALSFALGSLLMFSLDFLLPHTYFAIDERGVISGKIVKSSVLIAIGISLHNFPEGVAVASGYSYLPELGLVITIAVALHNIPEGMAIAIPIYKAGGSKLAAFRLALVSGLVEPLGAFVASLFLESFEGLIPIGLAFAGGVMVLVTLDELIPVARERGHEHFTSFGVIMGCIATFMLMAVIR